MKNEFSQGVCSDGAAILMDGQPMTPDEIVAKLRDQQHTIEVLMAAVSASKKFIDSHVADPDLTNEMITNYSKYKLAMHELAGFNDAP